MKNLLARPIVRLLLAVVIAVVIIVAPISSSSFINYQLSLIAVFAVALLGLNIVMGYTGQVSLGQSAFLGLGAYIAAYGVRQEWPVVVIFLLCCIIPAAVGLLVALAAARLRGLALAMVTIALPIIGVPLAKRFPDFTGGSVGSTVSWLEAPEGSGLADDQFRYYLVVAIAVVLFILGRNLVRGRIGRAFAIVKSNEAVALSMGISPYRYKVLAFTIASLFGGASGFLYIAVVQYTSPETLSFATSINLVAAMVIGGSASILGTVLGAIYFVMLPVVAGQIDSSRTALISGAALLLVLFLLPGGLVSLPRRIAQLVRGGRGGSPRSRAAADRPPTGDTAPRTTAAPEAEKQPR
ncbi:branched-chain amino acid ABC transporter permease [Naasia lichenicola]|uniref:Branched-chain amino acid ABC transporter permease n=1 Tax=Naasia lichenicola TaxID=2565933 RepID=A0A4S4FHY4_9MICO|nr:branched-chain amino acid ABC transporter permease [Naasia lichenicola]THG29943.1 branched-chain amino acid ABC transporter permease [Naasia lichenicola]